MSEQGRLAELISSLKQQRDELARTLDTIAERYGQSAVRRASMLRRDRSKREPPEE